MHMVECTHYYFIHNDVGAWFVTRWHATQYYDGHLCPHLSVLEPLFLAVFYLHYLMLL